MYPISAVFFPIIKVLCFTQCDAFTHCAVNNTSDPQSLCIRKARAGSDLLSKRRGLNGLFAFRGYCKGKTASFFENVRIICEAAEMLR